MTLAISMRYPTGWVDLLIWTPIEWGTGGHAAAAAAKSSLMGIHDVSNIGDERAFQRFTSLLLDDIRALEQMIEAGMIERGVRRIGAEQEMFLVDPSMRPAAVALDVLGAAHDKRLTTEIGKFNLEGNLPPIPLDAHCFSRLEAGLNEIINSASTAAESCGARVLLTGILPTLRIADLKLDNLTPNPRYFELNRAITRQRGGNLAIHIKGLDELHAVHDNIMMESCNTSFQFHYQVDPDSFAADYNLAQAITAPVLAAAVNSPILLGHRLWHETRVALFQHSVDARPGSHLARSHPTRVSFGESWVGNSVLEIYREDVARFRIIMTTEVTEDPFEALAEGRVPQLLALRLHNSTVWRWNRPCYGITDGVPHIRIENRALPAGPTAVDEVANAAFFVGLMSALRHEYGDIAKQMPFDDAKENFFLAARYGMGAQFKWLGGTVCTPAELITGHLLPLARQGLGACGIDSSEANKYLDIIEERVKSGQTGAQWMLNSISAMRNQGTREIRNRTLTAVTLWRQQGGEPVHTWPIIEMIGSDDWRHNYQTVGQFMATDLFTVRPDDLIDFAASVMDWRHVRHVPVEDGDGNLIGILSHRDLLRLLARGWPTRGAQPVTVRSIMKPNPVTVTPDTSTLEAVELMQRKSVGCLPVVERGHLVGIVTATDFLSVAKVLFEKYFAPE